MKQRKRTLDELLSGYADALRDYGLAYSTQLLYLQKANVFVKWMELHGATYLDSSLIAQYYHEVDEKWYRGDIQSRFNHVLHRQVDRFLYFTQTGAMKLPYPLKGAKTTLQPEFARIADAYLTSGRFHANTICDMRWITYKYFDWLSSRGFANLNGVDATQITQFMLYSSERMSQNSMHDIKLHLSKLYRFLYAAGFSKSEYRSLFSFTVNRESKIYPPLPKSEIVEMLDAIDRTRK